MKIKAWAEIVIDQNRIAVYQNNHGVYAIYPSKEAAQAAHRREENKQVVEIEINLKPKK